MSNTSKDASERAFQEKLVKELEKFKWVSPDELNGTLHKVTVDDLIAHWRRELNRINADQLEGVPLTDDEFKQVMAKVKQIHNSYEAAKILSMEEGKGKIDGIYRDPHPRVKRQQITLTIFKKAEVRGGDSSYRLAQEVSTENGNRFDIIMLINGLPLINIELKRTDRNLDAAFHQFKRYYYDGEFNNNFMAFSQMMVIASEIETRYFATPKSISHFNPSFVFHWTDRHNKPVNNWQQVVAQFLMIPMAHQLVGDYLIIDEARYEEDRKHMLMRPYQVHALQAVEGAAFGWNNDGIPHGGFVWHTTGSGKTITSFKTALFLATRAGFDKVIFLVDRRELDANTSEKFKAYAAYEPVSVDDTAYTYQLRTQFHSPKPGIVVTTTFKLNNLVKELNEAQDDSLRHKKYVFIIDEAHRTTMGQMMGTIKEYFKLNSLFFGFTGTPLFDESKVKGKINEKSEVIDTTEKLFGPLLHKYTIDEAIGDGNVLGFHVEYINTGEFESYEDLRHQLIERYINNKPDLNIKTVEKNIFSMTDLEVEREAVKLGLLSYYDPTHIPTVVTEILDNWEDQSQGRVFNAILTVAYKKRVIAYYNEFKKQLAEREQKLNVAMTFSFGGDNDSEGVDFDVIEEMFADYGSFTGVEFYVGDKNRGERAYFEDIADRGKRGGSGRNQRNIDLIIVADQLLTGYDSQYLNTLYVDRQLELHGLIQAYSRTNRILDRRKEFGTIINYQYPKITEDQVNLALKLYGSGGSNSLAIVEKYATAVDIFAAQIRAMIPTLPYPTEWAEIQHHEEEKKQFLNGFRRAVEQLNRVQQYYEYEWDDNSFGIKEHTWLQYVGAYKNLTRDDESVPNVDFILPVGKTKTVGIQIIDAAHIIKLIGEKVSYDKATQRVDAETLRLIHEEIQELSDMGEARQAKLIKEFVDSELVPGHIPSDIRFDDAYAKWRQERVQVAIDAYADKWGLDRELLARSMAEYSLAEPEFVPYIDDLTRTVDYSRAHNPTAKSALEHNIQLSQNLPLWLAETEEKYG
ncbi:MAG: type I restriction endonuclease subunit R [Fastidiosipilaceae bacterium]|jgi:type I restriction enzyme R subunit|nr:type I restriction endonuclease subunit R [Clostridiaceae bacterium]